MTDATTIEKPARTKGKSKAEGPNKSQFLRRHLIHHPAASVEDIQHAWEKAGHKGQVTKGDWYAARNAIKVRWHCDVDKLPQSHGKLNLSGMIYLFLNRHPTGNYEKCAKFFAMDGLKLEKGLFSNRKSAWMAKHKTHKAAPAETPSETNAKTPRARKVGKQGRRKKYRKSVEEMTDKERLASKYEKMEVQLDELIQEADNMKHWELVAQLRKSRRMASAKVLQFAE